MPDFLDVVFEVIDVEDNIPNVVLAEGTEVDEPLQATLSSTGNEGIKTPAKNNTTR